MDSQLKISFIGAGNMAASLMGGLIARGLPAENICLSDPNKNRLAELEKSFAVGGNTNNSECIRHAQVVVLAVKPQIMDQVLQEIGPIVQKTKPLIISIAAGLTLAKISAGLSTDNLAIVRCMPNTPALVQCGATGLIANHQVNPEQKNIAESILQAVGIALWFDEEKQLDAVTALSGSGPAYFFLVMEAMIAAAVEMGLNAQQAEQLTLQTALGAAKMASTSDVDVRELRRQVTSPGGTTEQAIQSLEQDGLRKIFSTALTAAKIRSEELGK